MLSTLIIPIGTALAGWLSVAAVGKLAFWPKQPMTLGPITLQGALPKQRQAISAAITSIAGSQGLVEQVEKLDIRQDVATMLSSRIDVVLAKFIEQTPIAAMILNDSVKNRIKELVVTEVSSELPSLQRNIANKMASQIDPAGSIDWDKLEMRIEQGAESALSKAKWLGAAIGFVVGLIELAVTS